MRSGTFIGLAIQLLYRGTSPTQSNPPTHAFFYGVQVRAAVTFPLDERLCTREFYLTFTELWKDYSRGGAADRPGRDDTASCSVRWGLQAIKLFNGTSNDDRGAAAQRGGLDPRRLDINKHERNVVAHNVYRHGMPLTVGFTAPHPETTKIKQDTQAWGSMGVYDARRGYKFIQVLVTTAMIAQDPSVLSAVKYRLRRAPIR